VNQTETELANSETGTVALAAATVRDSDVLVVVRGDVDVVRVRAGSGEAIASVGRDQVMIPGRADDTIALVNRDLYATLGVERIARAFATPTTDSDALERDVKSIMDDAKRAPNHGPFTIVVMQLVHKPGSATP
jgi:hypothetical protein